MESKMHLIESAYDESSKDFEIIQSLESLKSQSRVDSIIDSYTFGNV